MRERQFRKRQTLQIHSSGSSQLGQEQTLIPEQGIPETANKLDVVDLLYMGVSVSITVRFANQIHLTNKKLN